VNSDDDATIAQLAELDDALRTGDVPANECATVVLPALSTLRALDTLRPRPNRSVTPQTQIGRFVIDRELGRGGFGVVFLAHDPALGRSVAVKVPFPHVLSDPILLERFRREARAAAQLSHPNIVPVHEIGVDPPAVYIASEYVTGGTLADRLTKEGPLPALEAAGLIEAIARGIAIAHEAGIVHRDIKPANILLTSDGTPRLTDFGLSLVVDAGVTGITRSGTAMGTPAYMAPEQARGRPREASPSIDIYALGAVLYECLTGRPPFVGETEMEIVQQVVEWDPIPLRRLHPRIPRDLETVVLKCLCKEPSGRYRTAREFTDDLRHLQRGEPVVARPVGPVRRFIRRCRRRPLVASLGFGLAAAVIAGVVGIVSEYRRAEAGRADATDSQNRSERLLAHSRMSLDEMIELGQQFTHDPANAATGRDILESARRHYARVLPEGGGDPRLHRQAATVCSRLAMFYANALRNDDALTAMEEAFDHFEELNRTDGLTFAERQRFVRLGIIDVIAIVNNRGDRERGLALRERVVPHLNHLRAEKPEDADFAHWEAALHHQRGAFALRRNDRTTAVAELELAIAVLEQIPTQRMGHNQIALLALTLERLSRTRLAQGHIDEAKRLDIQLTEVAGRVPPSYFGRPPEIFQAMAMANRGHVADAEGRGDDAVAHFREAMHRFQTLSVNVPKAHVPWVQSDLYSVTNALVKLLDRQGRQSEGTAILESLIQAAERLPADRAHAPKQEWVSIQLSLIDRWIAAGRLDDARKLHTQVGKGLSQLSDPLYVQESIKQLKVQQSQLRSKNQ
jgi:hypothetical protein